MQREGDALLTIGDRLDQALGALGGTRRGCCTPEMEQRVVDEADRSHSRVILRDPALSMIRAVELAQGSSARIQEENANSIILATINPE